MKGILHECKEFDVIDVYRKSSDMKIYWKLKCQVCGEIMEECIEEDETEHDTTNV